MTLPPSALVMAQDDDPPAIHFGGSDNLDLDALLDFYVAERLSQMGYEVEMTNFASSGLRVEAMMRNDIHFVTGSVRNTWRAVAEVAEILTLAETVGMDFVIIGAADIQSCKDWNGRTIAHDELTSPTAATGDYYFAEVCPDAQPEFAYIDGSNARIYAIFSGSVDASVVHLDAALLLLNDAPTISTSSAICLTHYPGCWALI